MYASSVSLSLSLSPCVCVCVCGRERDCVCVGGRDSVCVRARVCARVCARARVNRCFLRKGPQSNYPRDKKSRPFCPSHTDVSSINLLILDYCHQISLYKLLTFASQQCACVCACARACVRARTCVYSPRQYLMDRERENKKSGNIFISNQIIYYLHYKGHNLSIL